MKKIINHKLLKALLELVLPSLLVYLVFLYSHLIEDYRIYIVSIIFSFFIYLPLILEWNRRSNKNSDNENLKYLYIIVMFFMFGIGTSFIDNFNTEIKYQKIESKKRANKLIERILKKN